jgi:PhoPQ-activated pathogenicity-related protein
MILEITSDLKKYVTVAQSFEFEDFEPYIQKAINAYIHKYVGNLHELLKDEPTGENAIIKNEAREHLRSAIANFGMYIFLPYLQVQLDSSGISVNTSENRKSAEWWQTKDIRRELLRAGHESMDLLLRKDKSQTYIYYFV